MDVDFLAQSGGVDLGYYVFIRKRGNFTESIVMQRLDRDNLDWG